MARKPLDCWVSHIFKRVTRRTDDITRTYGSGIFEFLALQVKELNAGSTFVVTIVCEVRLEGQEGQNTRGITPLYDLLLHYQLLV
jgi:hypothetical protein